MPERLSGPDPDGLSTQTAQLLSLTERNGRPPATIALLAHDEPLLGPFLGWAAALAREGVLEPREHEILALRASHLCESRFEWVEHRRFALDAGLTEAEVDAVAVGAEAGTWSDRERLLLRAADELVSGHSVEHETYTSLAQHFDAAALVEIPLVVGQYTMLSMMTGFFNVPGEGLATPRN